jgi:subtilisin family serine protease
VLHRRRIARLAALAVAAGIALTTAPGPTTAAAPTPTRQAADAAAYRGRLIVTWKGAAPSALGLEGVRSVEGTAWPMRSVVGARASEAAMVAARLRADPRVLAVVPDARLAFTAWPVDAPPDDPLYVDQGDLPQIAVPDAWAVTTGDPSVVVAVIDSGVDLTHPDLDDVAVKDPRNMVWNNADVTDEVGHGTWVAGTIVAETDNGTGVAGIAPGVTLMPIKIADDYGGISFADALDAVDWARDHGADIINMSFGGYLTSEQVALGQPTFTAARDAGVLMVAASGNEGMSERNYPASFRGVVSVGAVDSEDQLADFSTTGRALDLVAPGVETWSTVPDGDYEPGSGTSGASPHVAGVAALVWSARPTLQVDELEAVLRASAVDLGVPGWDLLFGDGRIDAAAALVEPVPDPLPDLEPAPALPELELTFLAPTAPVVQTGSTYDARVQSNHEVSEGYALLGDWRIDAGKCDYRGSVRLHDLAYADEMPLARLRQGRCYRILVVAIDVDGNFAEATSKPIMVVDPIEPRIVRRRPAPGSTRIDQDANIRVRFSEPLRAPVGTVRLRNLDTGLIVRTTTRWIKRTNTLVLDPVLRMYPRTRYRVEVTSRAQDRTGNPVGAQQWVFRTGR